VLSLNLRTIWCLGAAMCSGHTPFGHLSTVASIATTLGRHSGIAGRPGLCLAHVLHCETLTFGVHGVADGTAAIMPAP
jgi:hypothetical protein